MLDPPVIHGQPACLLKIFRKDSSHDSRLKKKSNMFIDVVAVIEFGGKTGSFLQEICVILVCSHLGGQCSLHCIDISFFVLRDDEKAGKSLEIRHEVRGPPQPQNRKRREIGQKRHKYVTKV